MLQMYFFHLITLQTFTRYAKICTFFCSTLSESMLSVLACGACDQFHVWWDLRRFRYLHVKYLDDITKYCMYTTTVQLYCSHARLYVHCPLLLIFCTADILFSCVLTLYYVCPGYNCKRIHWGICLYLVFHLGSNCWGEGRDLHIFMYV
jgi:hypothetical protein